MKNVKRIISVITILALVAVMFSAVTLTTAAEDRFYAGSTPAANYAWLENADGVRDDTLKLGDCNVDGIAGGKLITNAEGTVVPGSIVYQFTDALQSVQLIAGFSTSSWLGLVTVEASADGVNFTPVEMNLDAKSGNYWAGADVYSWNLYTAASDFTAEQNIRYIKVKLPNIGVFAAPGLDTVNYISYSKTATYANTVDHNGAYATEGTVLDGGANFSAPYYYFQGSGAFTFASKDLAPITDFCAKLLLHNANRGTSLNAQISSDGVNFTTVRLAVAKNGEYENSAWDCSGYDAYGTFTKEDNVRFIKIGLTNTITCAAGFRAFSYNSADMSDAYYANSFDVANASTEEGNTIAAGSAGGYLVAKDGAATEGSMIFYDENGISDFKAEYAQVFEAYGAIYFYASVDGNTWDAVTGKDTDTGEIFAGDGNCHKHIFTTTLAPYKGYKYLKAFFKNGQEVTHIPVMFNVYYNNASQMGAKNPALSTSEYKEAYDVTLAASSLTATALDEGATYMDVNGIGAGFQIAGNYAFGKDGAWSRGYVELYEGAVITDLNIDAFAQSVGLKGSEMELEVSSDGKVWLPVATTKNIFDTAHSAWGAAACSHNFVSLDPAAQIHYIRLTFNSRIAWLDFAPALKSISYNYVKIEESNYTMCNGHETGINSGDASVVKTPYVDGAVFADAGTVNGQLAGYNAFFKDNEWQPGEIVFYSDAAITDYCITAFSGNSANFGMLKFYGSADGVHYTPLNPQKMVFQPAYSGWGDLGQNYFYGKFLTSADIHYLMVEYVEKGTWIQAAPAVSTVWINTVETCNNPNIGHQNGEPVTVPATCTEEGSITTTCARCGESTVEVIPVIDHSFTEYVSDGNATPVADGTKTATCDNGCGETDTITDEGSRFDCIYEDVADSDGNGVINAVDYTAFRKVLMNEAEADLNGDGVTDILDLIRLKNFILNSAEGPEINVDSAVSDDSSNMD